MTVASSPKILKVKDQYVVRAESPIMLDTDLDVSDNGKAWTAVISEDFRILGLVAFNKKYHIFACLPKGKESAASSSNSEEQPRRLGELLAVKVPTPGLDGGEDDGGDETLHKEKLFWDRLQSEFQTLSPSGSPDWYRQNVTPHVHSRKSSEDRLSWMSYPLVNCSVDLHDFLAYLKEQKIQIPGVFALRLVKELGILLRKMHASDVMHEDLHEGNVLLSIHTLHNGERRPHLTLIDFESASYDLTISAIRKELDDYQEFYKLTQRLFPSFSDETTNVTPGGANVAQLLEEARKNLAEVFMFTKDPADRTTFDSLWQGVSNAAEDAMKQHNIAEDDGLPDSVLKLIDDAIEEKGVSITEEDLNHEVVL